MGTYSTYEEYSYIVALFKTIVFCSSHLPCPCISPVNVASDTQMPHDTGDHECKTRENGSPQQGSPFHPPPPKVSQRPQRNVYVKKVTDEKGGKQSPDDLFLQCRL